MNGRGTEYGGKEGEKILGAHEADIIFILGHNNINFYPLSLEQKSAKITTSALSLLDMYINLRSRRGMSESYTAIPRRRVIEKVMSKSPAELGIACIAGYYICRNEEATTVPLASAIDMLANTIPKNQLRREGDI